MPNADVFISYKRSQRLQIALIAERLRELGLSVWLDAELEPGEIFDEEIKHEVHSAKAVLVCWTPEADASEWVRAEAMIGLQRGVLAAVLLSTTELHPPFNVVHTEDLIGWTGEASHAGWSRLITRLEKLIHRRVKTPIEFAFEPKALFNRMPPPRQGERWTEIACFHAGKATFPPWTSSESFLTAFEWSASERVIFTAGQLNGLRCWTESGMEIERMKLKTKGIRFYTGSMAVLDFRTTPLVATAGHGPLCVWRQGWYEGSAYVLAFQYDFTDAAYVTALAWQPVPDYGNDVPPLAASVSHEHGGEGAVCLWDVRSGVKTWTHPCHVSYRLHWSPAGDHLAVPKHSGYGFEIFRLSGERLSFKTCDEDKFEEGYNSARMGFAWHPSGQYFATGISDKEIGIFELASLNLVRTLVIGMGHRSSVKSVQWAPDGQHLTAATSVGTVAVFDADRGVQQSAMYGTSIEPNDLAFSPDGQRLATRGEHALRLWDPASGEEIASISSAGAEIKQIHWHPDSRRIAFAHGNGRVKIARLEF